MEIRTQSRFSQYHEPHASYQVTLGMRTDPKWLQDTGVKNLPLPSMLLRRPMSSIVDYRHKNLEGLYAHTTESG